MGQWRIRLRSCLKYILTMLLRVVPISVLRALLEAATESISRRGLDFVTTRSRPKSGSSLSGPYKLLEPILPVLDRPIGIVVQGPLLLVDDFTVETVRYYLRVRPDVMVIVSTWHGQDAAALARIRDLGAEVVLSQRPECPGRFNVNFQAISTRAGILRAMELGCNYVAKTRSDNRVYCLSMLLSLPRLLDFFPVRNTNRQQKRLISMSLTTPKYNPYFVADSFFFGAVDDMLAYWSPRLDEIKNRDELTAGNDRKDDRRQRVDYSPEHFLLREFLAKEETGIEFTLQSWWKLLADRFCIIDWISLDIYWPKYNPYLERIDLMSEQDPYQHQLRFIDWLTLYFTSGNDWSSSPEYLLQQKDITSLPSRFPRGASKPY